MRLLAALACALLLISGCTSGGDESSKPVAEALTFDSLDLGWPDAGDRLATVDPPKVPEGFDAGRYQRMVDTLIIWADATSLEADVRGSEDPAEAVGAELPAAVRSQVVKLGAKTIAPRLSAANVFAGDVTVVGSPRLTTAWSADTVDREGAPALSLKLQTRAAYEVRVKDGPMRVIGVLRVHELITRTGAKGDIGVGFGWQEFGASDCALATDDALSPDGDIATAKSDLKTFVAIGSGGTVQMPDLDAGSTVDQKYLDRCERGQV